MFLTQQAPDDCLTQGIYQIRTMCLVQIQSYRTGKLVVCWLLRQQGKMKIPYGKNCHLCHHMFYTTFTLHLLYISTCLLLLRWHTVKLTQTKHTGNVNIRQRTEGLIWKKICPQSYDFATSLKMGDLFSLCNNFVKLHL